MYIRICVDWLVVGVRCVVVRACVCVAFPRVRLAHVGMFRTALNETAISLVM